ncbi:MAG: hypothetical protein IT161_06210 [Bryobacterales bacterium]|nr:hypothetical protein [Bryobacterales bacterium]
MCAIPGVGHIKQNARWQFVLDAERELMDVADVAAEVAEGITAAGERGKASAAARGLEDAAGIGIGQFVRRG